MEIATITAAYEGLKIGKSILKALYESKVEADAKEKIDEVMSKLREAQDTLFSMREELFRLQSDNESLKKKLAEANSWDNKLSQYELAETAGAAVVYKYSGTPEHFICPSCVSKKNWGSKNWGAERVCYKLGPLLTGGVRVKTNYG